MDAEMRKRGWSISEEQDDDNDNNNNNNNNNNNKSKPLAQHQRRPRANTDHSEDTLTAAEKQDLLNSFPTDELDKASHHDLEEHVNGNGASSSGKRGRGKTSMEDKAQPRIHMPDDDDEESESESEADAIEMFGGSSDSDDSADNDDSKPAKKRRKVDNNADADADNDAEISEKDANEIAEAKAEAAAKEKRLEEAKGRLSKWASRLFDPNRPRGLVEAPEVIPLNDEFLISFGKREKEFNEATGRKLELEGEDLDDMDGLLSADDGDGDADGENGDGAKGRKAKGMKVKISNIAFNTSEKSLTRLCQEYGPLNEVKLLMDEQNPSRSKGRAYVVFESAQDAESFIENMNEKTFEGRSLRVNAVVDKPKGRDSMGGRKVNLARYWEKDITTKCFRCGGIGHMASQCTNAEVSKPCPLCAKTGHDSYSCPLSKICFNCGVPGHINRECPERRGMPSRLVCSRCFRSGHHQWQCTEKVYHIPSYNATCLVCAKDGGFMCCEKMKWYFDLSNIFCFNCGRSGHLGSNCDRPTFTELFRNSDLFQKELERAEAKSLEDELEEQRQKRRDRERSHRRGRDRERNSNGSRDNNRAKSQPTSRFRPQNQVSNYGRINRSERSGYEDREGSRNSYGREGRRKSSGSDTRNSSRSRGYR